MASRSWPARCARRALARRLLRDVPDFPKQDILFKDITPLLGDASLFPRLTQRLASWFAERGVTHVAGIESRGFILGAPIAQHLAAGFIPLRKPGKLPARINRVEYALEYGADALEAHADACDGDSRVLLVDDVLATGGTADAGCRLVETLGATVVGCVFLVEIGGLAGAKRLSGREIVSLIHC